MMTRDSQEKDVITIQEYTMPKDSTTDDNQQGKRDASNMYVEMGFYMLVFKHPFIFSINLLVYKQVLQMKTQKNSILIHPPSA